MINVEITIPKEITGPIYVAGDSTVRILFETLPDIFVNAGNSSITAYSLGKESEHASDNTPEGSTLLFLFGEIDGRHYIPMVAKEKKISVEAATREVVHNYNAFLLERKEKYKLIVLGPYVTHQDIEYKKYVQPADPCYHNTFEEIREAKRTLNEQLQRFCEEQDILFIPLFYISMRNRWHEFPEEYFQDLGHLGPIVVPFILDNLKYL